MTQDAVHVGIDVAKARLDVCIWPAGEVFSLANDKTGHAALIHRIAALDPVAIGLEASGGYERDVLAALRQAGLPAHRLNPLRVRRFAQGCGFLAKNDRIDAEAIARFVAMMPQRQLDADPAAAALAELVTARRQLVDELTRCTNQTEQATHIVLTRLAQRRIRQLKAEIVLLDRTLAKAVAADTRLAHKDALLRSVPGVGPVTSHTLLAFMTELGRIENRQAAALVGVAPFDCQSGGFNGPRRIAGGRKPVRDTLYMAALVASRFNPVLADFKQRLAQHGKPPKLVLIAVARKLISILNAIIRTNTPWTA